MRSLSWCRRQLIRTERLHVRTEARQGSWNFLEQCGDTNRSDRGARIMGGARNGFGERVVRAERGKQSLVLLQYMVQVPESFAQDTQFIVQR